MNQQGWQPKHIVRGDPNRSLGTCKTCGTNMTLLNRWTTHDNDVCDACWTKVEDDAREQLRAMREAK